MQEVDETGEHSPQPPVDFGRRHVVVKLEIPFRSGADGSESAQMERCSQLAQAERGAKLVQAGRGGGTSDPLRVGRGSELAHAYADALIAEIDANAPEFADCEVRAVRMGGGDVATLRPEDVVRIMDAVRAGYAVAPDMPVTLRISFAGVEKAMLESWLHAGVTRVDREFPTPDGSSWPSAAWASSDWSSANRSAADERLGRGAILLFGGEETVEGFGDIVEQVVRGGVEHVALERATRGASRDVAQTAAGIAEVAEAQLTTAQTDSARVAAARVAEAQLTAARDVLVGAGFKEYVPLHFAREGCEDRFALLDAFGIDTLAFGVGATTRFSRTLTKNTTDLKRYLLGSSDYRLITQSSGPIVGR